MLKNEAVLEAVAQAEAEKAKHHIEHCPKCRRVLKIQVSEMRRRIPPGTQLPGVSKPEPAGETPPQEGNESGQ